MIKILAKFVRPIIEEANRQIYVARSNEAAKVGASGLKRIWFMIFGSDSLWTRNSSHEQRKVLSAIIDPPYTTEYIASGMPDKGYNRNTF